jgi:hypothetical protein
VDAVALRQAFGEHLTPQVTLAGESLRRTKNRVVQSSELDLQIALLGNAAVFRTASGSLGKESLHLLRRAQEKLLGLVPHPLGIVALALGTDADEQVVRLPVLTVDVVNIVGRHQVQPELLGPRDQVTVHLRLLGNPVVLQFEVEMVSTRKPA